MIDELWHKKLEPRRRNTMIKRIISKAVQLVNIHHRNILNTYPYHAKLSKKLEYFNRTLKIIAVRNFCDSSLENDSSARFVTEIIAENNCNKFVLRQK